MRGIQKLTKPGLLLSMLLLTGCATTTGLGAIDPFKGYDKGTYVKKAKENSLSVCKSWRPVGWSKRDTDETIREAKANNAAWKSWGCQRAK